MKKYRSIIHVLGVICACLIFTGCAANETGSSGGPASTFAGPTTGAHLQVYRVADFGVNLGLILSVDGKQVANLTEGRNYDGYLSPGQHVLSAQVYPNQAGASPWRKALTVKSGETYSYTAIWSGQAVSLVRNR